jgi:hypothetical protein
MSRLLKLIQILVLLVFLLNSETGYTQCNGDVALCNKRYDQVVYVTTHNGYNYSPAFQLPNQSYPISQQMVDGVRAFMLDVHDVLGTPTLFHGFVALGSEPLEDVLVDIRNFLQANPNEVLTIIFESNISASDVEAVFASSGLNPYLRIQPLSEPWPTLQELIDADERLVVFSDEDDSGPGQEWYHYMWDYCVETHYDNSSRADFSCDFNRGDSVNSLFILNHFITNQLAGTGELDSSIIANSNPYFIDRANQCMAEKGKLPNFLTVDFYDVGDVFDTKDELNANFIAVEDVEPEMLQMSVFPNPSSRTIKISIWGQDAWAWRVDVRDLHGRLKASYTDYEEVTGGLEIPVSQIGQGVFFIELWEHQELLTVEKIVLLSQ